MSAAGWDEPIDRHLSRQAVERGLSRHSMDAYAHDLSVFQSWCRRAGLTPAQLDAAALTAYLEALADRAWRSVRSGAISPACAGSRASWWTRKSSSAIPRRR